MKRIRNETYSGNNGNTIKISNGSASTRIEVESLKLIIDPKYNEKLDLTKEILDAGSFEEMIKDLKKE